MFDFTHIIQVGYQHKRAEKAHRLSSTMTQNSSTYCHAAKLQYTLGLQSVLVCSAIAFMSELLHSQSCLL
jgi:hypothetical protein